MTIENFETINLSSKKRVILAILLSEGIHCDFLKYHKKGNLFGIEYAYTSPHSSRKEIVERIQTILKSAFDAEYNVRILQHNAKEWIQFSLTKRDHESERIAAEKAARADELEAREQMIMRSYEKAVAEFWGDSNTGPENTPTWITVGDYVKHHSFFVKLPYQYLVSDFPGNSVRVLGTFDSDRRGFANVVLGNGYNKIVNIREMFYTDRIGAIFDPSLLTRHCHTDWTFFSKRRYQVRYNFPVEIVPRNGGTTFISFYELAQINVDDKPRNTEENGHHYQQTIDVEFRGFQNLEPSEALRFAYSFKEVSELAVTLSSTLSIRKFEKGLSE